MHSHRPRKKKNGKKLVQSDYRRIPQDTAGSLNTIFFTILVGENPVHVFTGSDLITGSNRIGPDRARNWLFCSFLKHFLSLLCLYSIYIYDHNNDVWIIKVGDDSYYLTGSGPKMVK